MGAGQARLAVRSDYAAQLKRAHDELGVKRVRFHGVFDDSMGVVQSLSDSMSQISGADQFFNYNFMNIAAAYDNVLAAGVQPLVELSFMPSRLAREQSKVSVGDGMNSMPRSDTEWTDLIQAFARFLLHRYGADEVRQWLFEVWNEPNIGPFFNGTQDDYFHLYEITARALKDVDPALQVGGPATAEGHWIPELLEFARRNDVPVDFVSTHNYPGDELGEIFMADIVNDIFVEGAKRLTALGSGTTLEGVRAMMRDKSEQDEELPKGQMGRHAAKARSEAGDLPLIYTEWNVNAILTAGSNDTRKAAAFQIKSIVEMDPFVTGSSIWSFSDIFDEFMLLPQTFQGGFGLMTVDGIPKPQWHALTLMKTAGDRRYDLPITNDEIEVAVYESDTEKQVFVFRQRMQNVDAAPEPYEIDLELPHAPMSVVRSKIDEDHCNPLRIWQEMGSPVGLNETQIAEIVDGSTLTPEPLPVAYSNGVVHLSGELGVNDIHFFRLPLEHRAI